MIATKKSIFWQAFWGMMSITAAAPINYKALLVPPTPENAWNYKALLVPPTPENAWRMVGGAVSDAAKQIQDRTAT